MKVCREPFENIEIAHNGNVFFCCAHDVENNYIGNIYEQPFDEIWNSQRAVEIRQKVLNNDYSCCNSGLCYRLSNPDEYFDEIKPEYTLVTSKYPAEVKLLHDRECNANCIICRKNVYRNTKEENDKYNRLIKTLFIPLLKDAKKFIPNAIGDVFASRHSRELTKVIAETYPDIKFEILTNGILASPKIIKDLKIENRMDTVFISFHAATKETYNKIVKNGNFDMVMKNIKYLSELHSKGKLRVLQFNFVVNKYNFKEMIDFIHLARKYNAAPCFWELRDYNEDVHSFYEDLAVHLPSHPLHKQLLQVLNNDIFDTLQSHELFPVLADLRKKK